MTLGPKPDMRIKRESPESDWALLAGHEVDIMWMEGGFKSFHGRLQVETLDNYFLVHNGIVKDYSVVGRAYTVSMNPGDGILVAMLHTTDKCSKCEAFREYEHVKDATASITKEE